MKWYANVSDALLDRNFRDIQRIGLFVQRNRPTPRYPVPALLMHSESNLGERWSNWMDHADAITGKHY